MVYTTQLMTGLYSFFLSITTFFLRAPHQGTAHHWCCQSVVLSIVHHTLGSITGDMSSTPVSACRTLAMETGDGVYPCGHSFHCTAFNAFKVCCDAISAKVKCWPVSPGMQAAPHCHAWCGLRYMLLKPQYTPPSGTAQHMLRHVSPGCTHL